MSAMEQPAERSGRMTFTESGVSMSAVSAMKWTPQKMMCCTGVFASARSWTTLAASCASFRESPV